eukprot:275637-Pyramimonas_sp.AAC.1
MEAFLAALPQRSRGAPQGSPFPRFPESSLRARGFKIRSRSLVVPASSPSPPLQNPRSSSFDPAA